MSASADPDERFKEIDRLFDQVLDVPRAERQAFLERTAGSDRDLIDRVSELLRAEEDSQGLFEAPGPAASRELLEDLAARAPLARRIGRYLILEEIGRGGMGTVYRAEYEGEDYHQQVALKVLRRGIDTDDIVRRFVNERRILASLSHPNIARLQDGGATPDGRPYLVMELVDGEPIDAFCDRNRLSLRRRLELVLDATRAVQAAHNRLVVHRDLKASNILVTHEGQVKLLDFGIAKLLDPEEGGERTRTGLYLLTPDHASPEQLRGDPVTTATDVYQLGLLLYRLLTGQSPRPPGRSLSTQSREAVEGVHEVRRASTTVGLAADAETAKARGSTVPQLKRALSGDLDTLLAKALQEQPERRYSSAEELASDIRLFLDGRPISARPDTLAYRTGKLLRRHPWLLPALSVALLLIVTYAITVMRYTSQLEVERNAAQLEADRAQEIQGFLIDLFASADPFSPADQELGRRITVVEALDVGAKRLESSLEDRPAVRASLLAAISEVYGNLGVVDRALPLREEALELQKSLEGPESRAVRDSYGELAVLRSALGESERARELHSTRLELAQAAGPVDPVEVADARLQLGDFLTGIYESDAAELQFEALLESAILDEIPLKIVAGATRSLSDVQRRQGRNEEAEVTARKAVALVVQAHGESSIAAALARGSLAQTLGIVGKVEEAETHFAAALDTLERTVGVDHSLRLTTLSNLAVLRMGSGNNEGAEQILREIVYIARRVHGEVHPSVGGYLQNHGTVMASLGRLAEARALHERAAEIYRETLTVDNHTRALPLLSLSGIDLTEGRGASAERSASSALEILNSVLPEGHYISAVAECRVARALVLLQRPAEAEPFFERATVPLETTPYVPGYRSECLEAARDFYRAAGQTKRSAEIEAALNTEVSVSTG